MNTNNLRTYRVTLTGEQDLLLHNDNIRWASYMQEWAKTPANKPLSVAGDDRTPAHRWIGCLYIEGGRIVIPSDNLMTTLREGGAKCPTGKRGVTFKRQTQSGLLVNEIGWAILVNGKEVPLDKIKALEQEKEFEEHEKAVANLGFSLFVKRARIGKAKHVRVRPRFAKGWQISGTITVMDETITKETLHDILTFAGRFAGLGDWRPSSPSAPGPFGTFTAEVTDI
ncbi:MAG: hypothetical protein SFV32_12635 [Opitutaceae bacterium]|nr:hypothetical protein [Opitutaceae bacterium]